jgi:hypothetical protein
MNEEFVYNKAKNQRKVDFGFGRLSVEELEDIVEDPPIVDYKTYMRYRGYNLGKLLSLQPALSIILPKITQDEVFFYFTRGYIPNQTNIREKINDYYKYEGLEEINKTLIDQMYGGRQGFINRTSKNKLEDLVFTYDKIMGYKDKVYNLGKLNGLRMDLYDDSDEAFYNELYFLLTNTK